MPTSGFPTNSEHDFVVGKDDFSHLTINQSASQGSFYYFFNTDRNRLVKQFVLADRPTVRYVCDVTLIKKGERFTPRLVFVIRDKRLKTTTQVNAEDKGVRARVSLEECHEQFWQLINFLESFKDVDVPRASGLALVSHEDEAIVAALKKREPNSIREIVKSILASGSVTLSQHDVNQLLKRHEVLDEFRRALDEHPAEEAYWQDFFERNKWIFGYGLDYRILRQETSQPYYGGKDLYNRGGQRGDYLTHGGGDIMFTVLVEIKTPATPLLRGGKEIRSGAWSLSSELADAISQLQANVDQWERDSRALQNIDALEAKDVYTVKPKGIIVIGRLKELAQTRTKRETFQRFRNSLHAIDILTFDELYDRARFIVEHSDIAQ